MLCPTEFFGGLDKLKKNPVLRGFCRTKSRIEVLVLRRLGLCNDYA
jgi:hypothetical protein